MSMDLARENFSTQPDYLIADTTEISTGAKEAAVALSRGAVAVLNADGKLAAVTVADGKVTTDGIYGIVAEDAASGEPCIIYRSGTFFADALVLPDGAAAADVEVALRNIGIYLR